MNNISILRSLKKSAFLSTLSVSESVNGKYELSDGLSYYDHVHNETIYVGKGFLTDFATIPPILKPIIDNDAYIIRAPAVIHDFIYSTMMY